MSSDESVIVCLQTAKVALSSFIQALYETDTVMIVRRVYSNNSSVKLGVLVPHIKASYEVSLSLVPQTGSRSKLTDCSR